MSFSHNAAYAAEKAARRVFGINAGFYLVLPFLAVHMGNLGFGAAMVGPVLGLRTLSQQGLFLIGGTAADRIGCRPMIISGCSLRVVAFGLFALFTSLPGIITATVLAGLGAALDEPAPADLTVP